jgi:LPXTG-motif cell wall-anchored protein
MDNSSFFSILPFLLVVGVIIFFIMKKKKKNKEQTNKVSIRREKDEV